ncbi:MAG: glycine zipper family protein [Rickettsiales bacterium]
MSFKLLAGLGFKGSRYAYARGEKNLRKYDALIEDVVRHLLVNEKEGFWSDVRYNLCLIDDKNAQYRDVRDVYNASAEEELVRRFLDKIGHFDAKEDARRHNEKIEEIFSDSSLSPEEQKKLRKFRARHSVYKNFDDYRLDLNRTLRTLAPGRVALFLHAEHSLRKLDATPPEERNAKIRHEVKRCAFMARKMFLEDAKKVENKLLIANIFGRTVAGTASGMAVGAVGDATLAGGASLGVLAGVGALGGFVNGFVTGVSKYGTKISTLVKTYDKRIEASVGYIVESEIDETLHGMMQDAGLTYLPGKNASISKARQEEIEKILDVADPSAATAIADSLFNALRERGKDKQDPDFNPWKNASPQTLNLLTKIVGDAAPAPEPTPYEKELLGRIERLENQNATLRQENKFILQRVEDIERKMRKQETLVDVNLQSSQKKDWEEKYSQRSSKRQGVIVAFSMPVQESVVAETTSLKPIFTKETATSYVKQAEKDKLKALFCIAEKKAEELRASEVLASSSVAPLNTYRKGERMKLSRLYRYDPQKQAMVKAGRKKDAQKNQSWVSRVAASRAESRGEQLNDGRA